MRTFALVEKRTKKHSPFRFDYWLRVRSSEPASFYGGRIISFSFYPLSMPASVLGHIVFQFFVLLVLLAMNGILEEHLSVEAVIGQLY